MVEMRTSFQGVWNIVRFNWHFYVFTILFLATGILLIEYLDKSVKLYCGLLFGLVGSGTLVSLLVSHFVYDLSGLYEFNWLTKYAKTGSNVLNINAGFDETTEILTKKLEAVEFTVFDFYDPKRHTEISIKRARKAYPPYPDTRLVKTTALPLNDQSIDNLFVIFSAHEIREGAERVSFFKELNRVIKPGGTIFIVEHMRDLNNFLAYNIGFLHFYSRSTWMELFRKTNLTVHKEIKFTPFITAFLLKNHGDTC
jgi:SAM-dependent methyltransferase